ncbi:MAG: hypothetical protein RIQ81_2330 [Pseudomonadota bacterium]|jgi:uncharacterized protein YqeY
MGIKEQINDDLKIAMKARDQKATSVLRMILSEIKYVQSATNIHQELDDAAVAKVVASYQKKLAKAAEEFPDPAKKAEIHGEIAIVERYLPKKAGSDETMKAIDAVLAATTDRTFGVVMKQVLASLGSSADGKLVSELLKKRLDSK